MHLFTSVAMLVMSTVWCTPPRAQQNGLATKLSLATESPTVGKPIVLKLEATNTGANSARYDDQQAAVNNPLTVNGPNGAIVPHIGMSVQTMGAPTTLAAGASKTVFDDFDLAAHYLIEQPGKYTVQSRGRNGLPASNSLTIEVKPGKLDDYHKLLAALIRVAPPGWDVADYSGSIVFLSTPTNLKADAASITLSFKMAVRGGPQPAGRPAPHDLGMTGLGHAWVVADSKAAEKRWPDFVKVIAEQLKPFKRERD